MENAQDRYQRLIVASRGPRNQIVALLRDDVQWALESIRRTSLHIRALERRIMRGRFTLGSTDGAPRGERGRKKVSEVLNENRLHL